MTSPTAKLIVWSAALCCVSGASWAPDRGICHSQYNRQYAFHILMFFFLNFVLKIPMDSIGAGPYGCYIHDGFVAILRDCGLRKPLDVTSVSLSKLCLVENIVINDKQMSWRRLNLLLLFAWTDMLESVHTQKYRDTWAIISSKH